MFKADYHSKWLWPLRLLLIPVALLYGLLMQLRNALFDWGLFKTHRFPVKIISVGNLSAGGSGKTPVTMYLAAMLQEKYGAVAIVSRGYGRQSSGVRLVSDGHRIVTDTRQTGDEPFLMAKKLPAAVVVVAEKRARGIAFVLQQFKPSVVLLDDAFQHRSVVRDLDILLINSAERALDRWPLPTGFYREFALNRSRAGLILETHSHLTTQQENKDQGQTPYFEVRFKSGSWTNLRFQSVAPPADLSGRRVGAFAGIAHPQNFLASLQRQGAQVVFFQPFADHHAYTAAELQALIDRCKKQACTMLLCTEKDLVKVQALQNELPDLDQVSIWAPSLIVEIEKRELFEKKVIQTIDR